MRKILEQTFAKTIAEKMEDGAVPIPAGQK